MSEIHDKYGLSKRIVIKAIDEHHLAIVKNIKSRIIMKDAQKIFDIAQKIKQTDADITISLHCTPNICSKSIAFLKQHQIDIQFLPETLL